VNIEAILDMQSKLYRWSRGDRHKVFADLFNLVCDRRTLEIAWQRLVRNQGSNTPGTDGVTRRMIEEQPGGYAQYLGYLREELRDGTYRPQPVRQRLIPKRGKPGQLRPLGIPTLRDRLVQMALKLILEPIFEADFYPTSYGFRPGRCTHDAVARLGRLLHPSSNGPSRFAFAIEGDIKGCFDAIDHHALLDWWLWRRVFQWLRKKHRGIGTHALRRRYRRLTPTGARVWGEGARTMATFRDGGTTPYPDRGTNFPGPWDPGLPRLRMDARTVRITLNALNRHFGAPSAVG
jgi:Reverse transcriptase (RNA-dependent DNA polymerase)